MDRDRVEELLQISIDKRKVVSGGSGGSNNPNDGWTDRPKVKARWGGEPEWDYWDDVQHLKENPRYEGKELCRGRGDAFVILSSKTSLEPASKIEICYLLRAWLIRAWVVLSAAFVTALHKAIWGGVHTQKQLKLVDTEFRVKNTKVKTAFHCQNVDWFDTVSPLWLDHRIAKRTPTTWAGSKRSERLWYSNTKSSQTPSMLSMIVWEDQADGALKQTCSIGSVSDLRSEVASCSRHTPS